LTGTYYWSSLAYEAGTVFVNNFDGAITAFDAATGAQRWAQRTSYFAGELVARNGVVYEHGSSSVYALSAVTGEVLWNSGYLDGSGSSISVDDDGVYVAAGCSWFRLSLVTGGILWSGNDGCSGGGGGDTYPTPTRVFARANFGSGLVLDKETGATVGTYGGTPAFEGDTAYFANGNAIVAEDVLTLAPKFTTFLPAPVSTSPVIASGVVYVRAGANLYAVDATTGEITWSGAAPGQGGGGGQYTGPTADIAIGDGLLLVPSGNTLAAFGELRLTLPLPRTHTTLVASASESTYGQPVTLTATVSPTDGGGDVKFTVAGLVLPGCGSVPVQSVEAAYVATCTVSALPVGAHVVSAAYSGDEAYAASEGTFSVTVSPAPTVMVVKAAQLLPVNGYKRVGLLASLTSPTGAGLAGRPVTFIVGARTCAVTTNAQGIAKCVLTYSAGSTVAPRAWATFAGSKSYLASQAVTPIAPRA
jgi:outer membrane protein assembly factor BamB